MDQRSSFMYYSGNSDERTANSGEIGRNGLPRESNYRSSYLSSDHRPNWRLSGSQSVAEGSVNYGYDYEKTTEGYNIYTGKESMPITAPPKSLGDDAVVIQNQIASKFFFSNESIGIPTDEIELQAFGKRSYAGSLANTPFEQRQLHDGKEAYGSNTYSTVSEHEFDISKRERVLGLTFLKFFTIIVILWDIIADWIVVWKFDNHRCYKNIKIDETVLVHGDMCVAEREKMRQIFSVITMLGCIIGFLQIFNIILDIMYNWGLTSFRLSHAQYDLYLSLYFEEIPQAVILVIFNYICTCDVQGRSFSLIAMISGLARCFFRYGTSFRSLLGNHGCCNTWWRCCCCRQHAYLCQCGVQDCLCKCDIPCPLFCCTLRCDSCRWTTNTWCAGWMQMFSCFCSCCSEDKTMFGVRVMNSLGVMCLVACTSAMCVVWGIVPSAAY